jgi:hypothetical protein
LYPRTHVSGASLLLQYFPTLRNSPILKRLDRLGHFVRLERSPDLNTSHVSRLLLSVFRKSAILMHPQYMTVAVGDALAYKSTTDSTLATIFTLDTSNRLITTAADPEIACAYSSISNYYMEGLRHTYLDAHTQYFTPLNCKVNTDLTLGCTYKTANAFTYYASQSSFFYSTANYNNYPTYIAHLIMQ